MTSTLPTTTPTTADHPLAPLTAEEIDATREIAGAAGLLGDTTRFVYVGLAEAPKQDIVNYTPGSELDRTVEVMLLERATGVGTLATINVTRGEVAASRTIDLAAEGQAAILDEEFADIEGWLLSNPDWHAALKIRGLDPHKVRAVPLSAGNFGAEAESTRRMCRVLAFYQNDPQDLPWAHPIDGLLAHVDLTTGDVFELIDYEQYDVPTERAEWDAAPHGDGHARTDMKPLEIVQPEGASFIIEGNKITWADWEFRFTFDAREGLILHQLNWRDGDSVRPVLYRASVPEMVVAYGDPQPARYWINYFDQGEYIFGRYTNSLELGCDCLGEITYFDAVIADETGHPRAIKNAICLHEEDYGVLWKHTDMFNGMAQTRRQRRLVISFFLTIGNYDYGFYWYLYLDGTIALEAKATGVVFPSAYVGPDGFATEMAPGLGAPFHQHLFCARLDMAVDGHINAVDEADAVRIPISDSNPHGNGFRQQKTRIRTETESGRDADNLKGRHWIISNPQKQNRLGQDVAYALYPEGQPTLLADPSSAIYKRGAFARHHLWVTQHDDSQRWPAGAVVNQSPGDEGLGSWIEADRPVDGEDIVVWHTFGLTHFPRPEDWPVMPVDYAGFTMKPVGFFGANPALNAPASTARHCASDGGAEPTCH
ncbi:primary-amine oxidase [Epidermidibacterium keratini]|uniref:Amine oxidase n=1 Tax=Epidermidibacterium keratini TaxID=1891644 RepID=A0A7L4YJZ7_9ACTN|nr:primary-amine oxidase [Epidermidibacterium keratini]QHB99173.1 primary-amine oxidase [Epidermidibacterium keratini]